MTRGRRSRGDALRTWLARAAYDVMTVVAVRPGLALPAARLTGHGVLVAPDTDVVVEGYPHSGNSFAVAAMTVAQPGPVRVAHHTHAPGHVVVAVRAGIPALVLVRDPREAVVDLVLAKPALTVAHALRGYVRFYAPLLRYREGFVVGAFPTVTSDFASVVRALNERFATSFAEFRATPDDLDRVAAAVHGYQRRRRGPGLPVLGRGGGTGGRRPDEPGGDAASEGARDAARRAIDRPELATLRDRALGLYEVLVAR